MKTILEAYECRSCSALFAEKRLECAACGSRSGRTMTVNTLGGTGTKQVQETWYRRVELGGSR